MRRKIAIVNRTNLKNYGSVLQVYALCNIVNNMGYYARQTNSEIVVLGKVDSLDYPLKKIHRPVAGPAEFLSLTSKADMIITDSSNTFCIR